MAAVNSEGEVPIDIAEEDDMLNFLQQEIDNRGIGFTSFRYGFNVIIEKKNL